MLTHFEVSNTRLPGEASQKPPVEGAAGTGGGPYLSASGNGGGKDGWDGRVPVSGRLRLRRSPRALAKGNVDVDLCL